MVDKWSVHRGDKEKTFIYLIASAVLNTRLTAIKQKKKNHETIEEF